MNIRTHLWMLWLVPCAQIACGGGVTTTGVNGKEYMRLTEGIQWQYTDGVNSELYEVWCQGETEVGGETVTIYGWKYGDSQELVDDEGAGDLFFMETYWSKQTGGVFFHGSSGVDGSASDDDDSAAAPVDAGEPWRDQVYEYPLLFVAVDLSPGDIQESGSDGENWSSEYVEMTKDVVTDGGTYDALHMRFTDADEVSPFAGDYYLAHSIGIIQFQVAGDPDVVWSLKRIKES